MTINSIAIIGWQELIINIRNKWTLLFATIFGILVLAISYFGLITAGIIGFQGFARTSASLLNLVLYLVPLYSLMMTTLSFTSEKNCSELLFSQPVTRTEIVAGKWVGLFGSVLVSTLIGFGIAGLVISVRAGTEGASRYPFFVVFSLLLALIFIGLGILISALCERKTKAFGMALFLWFFFVLFYDLLAMGATFLLKERTANTFLFLSLFGNPVDIIRVASLIALDGKEIFGAAGVSLIRFLGGETLAMMSLAAGLLLWLAVPFLLIQKVVKQLDI